ncbi:transcriptional elongation regulator MINIYO [Quillaja saponaria]|uniref:Transcriptional elongation regulator MINIYO n=1 Tax=Quillaja saponaria TaxID=32244 RepID=A0AAD7P9M5_QUISA|nr:transcriptional elongation regulator MINIYO [Quillaja saponaria]
MFPRLCLTAAPWISYPCETNLPKSLLRDYSRSSNERACFLHLIHYNKPSTPHINKRQDGSCLEKSRVDSRLNVLIEACDGNSSLLAEVEKLKVSLDRVTL